jgi:hypothetical protein
MNLLARRPRDGVSPREAGGSNPEYSAAVKAAIRSRIYNDARVGADICLSPRPARIYLPDQESRSLVSERRLAG